MEPFEIHGVTFRQERRPDGVPVPDFHFALVRADKVLLRGEWALVLFFDIDRDHIYVIGGVAGAPPEYMSHRTINLAREHVMLALKADA